MKVISTNRPCTSAGRKKFKDWEVKQTVSPGKLCGMAGGLDGPWEINEARTDDFGQFVPWVD